MLIVRRLLNKAIRFKHHSYATLPYIEDCYGGVHVKIDDVSPVKKDSFDNLLSDSMEKWKTMGCSAVWLQFSISESGLIPIAAEHGFVFHHAEGNSAMLCKWMDRSVTSRLPRYATHQVGVAGCVVREDTKQILMVQERNRKYTMWKFPGGLSELSEDIGKTAEREAFEEAGIKTKFEGILTFRQQHNHPGAFGRSDMYFLCRMTPLNFDLHPCAHEIQACEWMHIDDVPKIANNSAVTLRVLQLITKGLQEGFDKVEVRPEMFKSIYKGRTYELFNIPAVEGIKDYIHDVTDESLLKTS